jgi:hypothetical protein
MAVAVSYGKLRIQVITEHEPCNKQKTAEFITFDDLKKSARFH